MLLIMLSSKLIILGAGAVIHSLSDQQDIRN